MWKTQSLENVLQYQHSHLAVEKNFIVRALIKNSTEYVENLAKGDPGTPKIYQGCFDEIQPFIQIQRYHVHL